MGTIEARQTMLSQEATLGGNRQPKHLSLNAAINDMASVISLMEELLNDINPRPQSDLVGTDAKPGPPTLADILNHGPDRIRSSNDGLRSLIHELREELI